ncbi:MAG: bifunctional demethylmenaquinone methyltransferase/2-methoxy-6-polyprenyl-1,4-benzoquinol methylase UbiE [Neomegalonema sp.]|nr:bifunctional demethylmenaquinone methyltransferase/2-methoxy-6-polyprenyl-1,4-benzoquinol methylase UbiE [Neomegalonema sp.]
MQDPNAPQMPPEAGEDTTHFGFTQVEKERKAGLVQGVFTRVASRYDLMNDFMSARMHRLWKDAMIDWLAPRKGSHLLDIAGGTGDITFRYLQRLGGMGEATVCDLTHGMLMEGRRRAQERGIRAPISWICGDAMHLPFPDKSFDYVTIAFGLRNVTEPEAALREAHRVLRPGGRFMCLEFSKVKVPVADKLYDLYSFNVIPQIGQIVANDRDSYQYLVESIRRFPSQENLGAMMQGAGFSRVDWRNMAGGVVALHSGWRI